MRCARDSTRLTLTRIAAAAFCCLAGPLTFAQPVAALPPAAGASAAEAMVLRVRLNAEDKGDFFLARTTDDDFLVKADDLRAMGFREPVPGSAVSFEGEPHVSLKSMPGVNYAFQVKDLTLVITAEPQLLQIRKFSSLEQRRRGTVPRESSGFFNYALEYANGSFADQTWNFAGEAGWRKDEYLFLTEAATREPLPSQRKLVRLMSSVIRDDRDSLQRWVAGDFFTQARELTGSVNFGGFSLSKLYGLNPYLVQFPTQSISGQAALPSDLEIYMDGQRIRTERIKPGEFEVRDIVAYGGARSIQLVLRDAFGRVQTVDYSFYFSDRPLQRGLHEYSYNLGAFRRGYGLDSSRYGPHGYSAFHRYGLTDSATVGIRIEGTTRLFNAGPSATLVLGPWGVLNLAAAGSAIGGRHGAAASVGYNYHSKAWSLNLSLRRDRGSYAVLGDPPLVTNRKSEGTIVVGYNFPPGYGSLALSHSGLTVDDARKSSSATSLQPFSVTALDKRRVTALSYNAPLVSGRASLTASLSHVKDTKSRNEFFVGVTIFLDKNYSSKASVRRESGRHSDVLQLTKNQPIGEGLGYLVTTERLSGTTGSATLLRSAAQYNAPAAILRAEYNMQRGQNGQSESDRRLSVAGGVAYAGGEVALGRPIVDSFGIVKVGELPGVKVFVSSQEMGKTNAQGKLFVPTLNSYYDNDISIAADTVPIEYQIVARIKKVSPSLRGGALIEFPVNRIQAFTGTLKFRDDPTTSSRPVVYGEISIVAEGKRAVSQTGRAGEFYLENLKPGTYAATAVFEGKTCSFGINIPRSDDTFVELPPIVCEPQP